MVDRLHQTTDERLQHVRQMADKLRAKNRYEYCHEFAPPCFVDCPCWHEAEAIVNGIYALQRELGGLDV